MAQQAAPSRPVLRVRRQEPELVVPTKPSPRELKPLSDLDNLASLRHHVSLVRMYRNNPSVNGKDPVEVIRKAVAQALVFYYPLAGRLREGPGWKLAVDCTDEGVLFVEADADFALDDFGDGLMPPFPCLDDLVCDIPAASSGALHCPLVLIQVTRLKCGGFIMALGINHTMSDAHGQAQFITAIAEMARGALSPSTPPCWSRESFFNARDPPRPGVVFPDSATAFTPFQDSVEKAFRFTRSHVSALRALAPESLRHHCSTFDLLTASIWRSRTAALQFAPTDQVYLVFAVNARRRGLTPPVPEGYYGNAMVTAVVIAAAGRLCGEPFGYALELVTKAKAGVTEKYVRLFVDRIAVGKGGRPFAALPPGRVFFVSDVRHAGDADFGWGGVAYAGPFLPVAGATKGLATYYVTCDGEIVAPLHLPRAAMKIFETQLHALSSSNGNFIRSGL